MARFPFVLASLGLALVVPACGLTLDYAPPDDAGMDAGPRDAARDDAEPAVDAEVDAPLEGDASDASLDAPLDRDAQAPCVSNTDCGDGSCVHPCDGMSGGYCVPGDEVCAAVQVCGCDGMVYGSACDAHRAGVEVAADSSLCAAVCSLDEPLACFEGSCVTCPGELPVCQRRAPLCRLEPVCGCDGNNYLGNCDAAAAGVRTFTLGVCHPGVDCATSLDCERGSYCERPGCDALFGTCQPLPTVVDAYACGCSGRRYVDSNRALLREGHLGSCDGCPVPTGCCSDAADCDRDEACVNNDPTGGLCRGTGNCVDLVLLSRPSDCWTDADCDPGLVCMGAYSCMCETLCLRADEPGSCVPPP